MKTIHKQVLADVTTSFGIREGAKVVHVGNQHEQITVWLEVDTNRPVGLMKLHVVGTGNPIPEDADQHLGAAIVSGGRFVFHVYSDRSTL